MKVITCSAVAVAKLAFNRTSQGILATMAFVGTLTKLCHSKISNTYETLPINDTSSGANDAFIEIDQITRGTTGMNLSIA
jgi:hypothetical protein